MTTPSILCVGATLYDLLLPESEQFLTGLNREKGGMTLVESADILDALKASQTLPQTAPGGSACNSAVGLARLGANVRFVGKRGLDEAGTTVEEKLTSWGVQCRLRTCETPTGQVLSIITPDAQRTLMTHLGAAAEFNASELEAGDFAGVDIVLLEGYLLFNGTLVERALELARQAGARVAMDLSSFEVVRFNRERLESMLPEHVDIIIANEDEAGEYTGSSPEESLELFAGLAETAVVKLGADGVLIARGDERHRVAGKRVKAVDTTGAGDMWAGGFLYGLAHGWPLDRAATLGNDMGAAVVSVVGAVIPDEVYDAIRAEHGLEG